jgi:hypothetical protein
MKQSLMHFLNERLFLRRKLTFDGAMVFWHTLRQACFSLSNGYRANQTFTSFYESNAVDLLDNFIEEWEHKLQQEKQRSNVLDRLRYCEWLNPKGKTCCDRTNICPFCWYRSKSWCLYQDILKNVHDKQPELYFFVGNIVGAWEKDKTSQLLKTAKQLNCRVSRILRTKNKTYWHRVCMGGDTRSPAVQIRLICTSDARKELCCILARPDMLEAVFERTIPSVKNEIQRVAGDYWAYPISFTHLYIHEMEPLLKAPHFRTRAQSHIERTAYAEREETIGIDDIGLASVSQDLAEQKHYGRRVIRTETDSSDRVLFSDTAHRGW